MLKFQITTKADLQEAANIERRRRNEEERKKRIFNARERLYGIDHETLQAQIQEKKRNDHEQAEYDRKYLEESRRRADIIKQKEKELEEERRKIEADVNFFRCRFQRKEDSREFDLNDPDFHKKSKPARLADKDNRLGISSAQIFCGEDLLSGDRARKQKEQQRAWLEQQIRERKQAENDRLRAEKEMQRAQEIRDRQVMDFECTDSKNRIQMQSAVAEFNRKLAMEHERKRQLEKQQEHEDNLAEIYNMLTSDMMTENPDVAQSNLAPNKKIAYLYRGMNSEELEKFRLEQKHHTEAIQKKKNEEAIIDAQWERYSQNLNRTVHMQQIQIERESKKRSEELRKENSELATEQNIREKCRNKEYSTNEATPEFFNQFNKTTR